MSALPKVMTSMDPDPSAVIIPRGDSRSFRFGEEAAPGDLSGGLALPWQAGFHMCNTHWQTFKISLPMGITDVLSR